MLGPFWILQKIRANAYSIDLPLDLKISPTFSVSNLYKYHPPDAFSTLSSSLMVELSHSGVDWQRIWALLSVSRKKKTRGFSYCWCFKSFAFKLNDVIPIVYLVFCLVSVQVVPLSHVYHLPLVNGVIYCLYQLYKSLGRAYLVLTQFWDIVKLSSFCYWMNWTNWSS